jgi:hypothetical protein
MWLERREFPASFFEGRWIHGQKTIHSSTKYDGESAEIILFMVLFPERE